MNDFDLTPMREAGWIALFQGITVGLLGSDALVLGIAGVGGTYLIAWRWADPRGLVAADTLLALLWLSVLSVPLGAVVGATTVGWLVALSAAGIALSRVRVAPPLYEDGSGVEAYIERVRAGEGGRSGRGNASRARLPGADPLNSLFGTAPQGALHEVEDPYRNAKSLHVDPEDL